MEKLVKLRSFTIGCGFGCEKMSKNQDLDLQKSKNSKFVSFCSFEAGFGCEGGICQKCRMWMWIWM